jgi:hypothetical protein
MSPARHGAGEGEHAPQHHPLGPQELPIQFVRALESGVVQGTLESYHDPQCGCLLSTTFVGEVRGDRIEGTYTTKGPLAHAVTDGRWRARRER